MATPPMEHKLTISGAEGESSPHPVKAMLTAYISKNHHFPDGLLHYWPPMIPCGVAEMITL